MKAAALTKEQYPIHPKKLLLWLAIVSIMMMFAGLVSAYVVKKVAGGWEPFVLPGIFGLSTLIIILSSGTMHLSYLSFKRNHFRTFRIALGLTLGLGIVFVVTQYYGYMALNNIGVYLDGNASGSFLYVISGLHAVHVMGGVIALLVTFILSFMKSLNPVDELMLETNPHKNVRIELVATYWHFVDLLWVALFIFFYFNHL